MKRKVVPTIFILHLNATPEGLAKIYDTLAINAGAGKTQKALAHHKDRQMNKNSTLAPKERLQSKDEWTRVGSIEAESGRIVVGDPCYIKELFANDAFGNELRKSYPC